MRAFDFLAKFFLSRPAGEVVINGQRYRGHDVSIVGGRVFVDGKEQPGTTLNFVINVQVLGDVQEVHTNNGDVRVDGTVGGDINTVNGDVTVGQGVLGSVKTVNGDITNGR